MKITALVLLIGIASLASLTGCSKPATPEPAATTSEASNDPAAMPAPVAAQAEPQRSGAEQAATLLKFIDDRPDCQQFRAPLEQAGAAQGGDTVDLNTSEIMERAYKAGCQKNPG